MAVPWPTGYAVLQPIWARVVTWRLGACLESLLIVWMKKGITVWGLIRNSVNATHCPCTSLHYLATRIHTVWLQNESSNQTVMQHLHRHATPTPSCNTVWLQNESSNQTVMQHLHRHATPTPSCNTVWLQNESSNQTVMQHLHTVTSRPVTGQNIPQSRIYPGLKRPRLDYTPGILRPRPIHTPLGHIVPPMMTTLSSDMHNK